MSKTVLGSIPVYSMETVLLPSSTCKEIDAHVKKFIWGTTHQTRKIHVVSWEDVCKKKEEGGLGLRHSKLINKAFMMKIAYGLLNNSDALRTKVLCNKYNCNVSQNPVIKFKI